MSDDTTRTPAAARHGNPGPRPALRRTSDDQLEVARPGSGAAAPDPGAGIAPLGPVAVVGAKDKSKHKGKDGKKHKDDKHKHKPDHSAKGAPAPEAESRDLTVTLPKSVRKALAKTAAEHGTTPERLVALVLSEWLDH
ncbi:MAG TPA: hypothetical protein VEV13_05585 [Candidatus Limnocylindria bacterium]|nr:hypothetical protein [Candidatus Limnocylindria bacterium]